MEVGLALSGSNASEYEKKSLGFGLKQHNYIGTLLDHCFFLKDKRGPKNYTKSELVLAALRLWSSGLGGSRRVIDG